MTNRSSARLLLGEFSEKSISTIAREALKQAGGKVTCGIVFLSADWRPHLADCLEIIQVHGHVPILIGCSGTGLIGRGREAEHESGMSLLLLSIPETNVRSFAFRQPQVEAAAGPGDWHEVTGFGPADPTAWIVLVDPLTLDVEPWLRQWNAAYPGVPVIGGLASGGASGDDIFVTVGHEILEGGAVALGLQGGLRVHPIVSQGCRPIGEPFTITGVDQNVVSSLGSRPAFEALSAAFRSLPDTLKAHAQGNIFAGLATSEYVDEFKSGDFLIRNIIGANPETGAVAISAFPRLGQTLQYQLRDRESAHRDLVLSAARVQAEGVEPFGSLLFSCTGRGRALFGTPDHDVSVLGRVFGDRPVAGFFCNGEIGPVSKANFVHGYTASVALLLDV